MLAGCLYGPVGTSGPKTRVIVSSPASRAVPSEIVIRPAKSDSDHLQLHGMRPWRKMNGVATIDGCHRNHSGFRGRDRASEQKRGRRERSSPVRCATPVALRPAERARNDRAGPRAGAEPGLARPAGQTSSAMRSPRSRAPAAWPFTIASMTSGTTRARSAPGWNGWSIRWGSTTSELSFTSSSPAGGSDATLAQVGNLSRARVLVLDGSPVTDVGLAHVAG